MAPPMVVENSGFQRFVVGNSRFYEEQFPEKEQLVMVKVSRVAEMGAYVSLLEYNNLEGMVLMSELSKRRIRSVNKIVRVGRLEVVLVLRVDKDKGYIDLSKKRVSPEDVVRCEDKFCKSKKVHQIMFHIAQKHSMKLEELNQSITWPLHKKYGHALDAFRNPEFSTVVADSLEISPAIKETLIEVVKLRLSSSTMKMRARVDIHCLGPDGVEAVRDALIRGRDVVMNGDPKADVKLKLISPPQYSIITACIDKEDGETRLKAGIEEMVKTIRKYQGGDGSMHGDFLIIGGDELERHANELDGSSSSDSSSDSDDSSEDEGMGRIDEGEILPADAKKAEDDDDE